MGTFEDETVSANRRAPGRTQRGAGDELTVIVTPVPEETTGLLRRMADLRRERRDGLSARIGRLGGRSVVVVSTGDGARNAERGLRAALASWRPHRVLVLGIAGGLTDELEVGQVVLGERLLDATGPAPAPDRAWGEAAGVFCASATVFSSLRLAVTPEEKLATRDGLPEGPAVVDLESAAFARAASDAGVPFVVMRAVSDRADEALPLDFNLFLGEDGGVRRADVVRHVAFRPQLIAPLMDLRRRVELCADRLAMAAEELVSA